MRFSDFSLIRVVGTGSFGRVHLAVHKATNAKVALKSLSKAQLVRLKQVEHTVSERDTLKAVSNSFNGFPFIVNLFGTFQDPMRVYFVMEHVGGGELFTLLRRREKLRDREARFYACEIALAIEHLHSLGIIFRDLKPENVLLDHNGHVKLVDFGFAKILPPSGETSTLCGTPEYLAPEVIQPADPEGGYTAAIDWWSFGVLVYEMIAGHPPFFVDGPPGGEPVDPAMEEFLDGEDDDGSPPPPIELYRKILDGRVGYPPWMSPLAKDFVRRLLVVDPSRRLGARLGDVESHPWFAGVNWEAVLRRQWEQPPAGPEELALAAAGDSAMEEEDGPRGGSGDAEFAVADGVPDPYAALFDGF
ncbi:kinase-like domain-containing protein [Zopfochytrium polystomum]|nr:kinase-like domain-containing protein [Zopfochytrium polystomum]